MIPFVSPGIVLVLGLVFFCVLFVLSLLILPISTFFYRKGWLNIFRSVRNSVLINILFLLVIVFLLYLISKPPSEFEAIMAFSFFLVYVPLLILSLASYFVFYGRYVGKRWYFTLAFMESILLFTIPLVWIPMLLYYPLMKKITLRYRRQLIKERLIRTTSRQSLQEYRSVIGYYYGFVAFNTGLIFLLNAMGK